MSGHIGQLREQPTQASERFGQIVREHVRFEDEEDAR
jgi:hypothetical protein